MTNHKDYCCIVPRKEDGVLVFIEIDALDPDSQIIAILFEKAIQIKIDGITLVKCNLSDQAWVPVNAAKKISVVNVLHAGSAHEAFVIHENVVIQRDKRHEQQNMAG